METSIRKWGNSLGIRLPKVFVNELQIINGSLIDMKLNNGVLEMHKISKGNSLDELLAKITTENIPEFIDSGDAEGKELW